MTVKRDIIYVWILYVVISGVIYAGRTYEAVSTLLYKEAVIGRITVKKTKGNDSKTGR